MRLTLDTCILAAGFRSRNGASYRLLQLVAEHKLIPVATPALYLEYESVLKRPEQVAVHGFSNMDIDRFLLLLAGFTEKVEIHYRWRPQLRDPNDELVLEAAISGQVDALVTFNTRDFLPAATQFGIRILQPGLS